MRTLTELHRHGLFHRLFAELLLVLLAGSLAACSSGGDGESDEPAPLPPPPPPPPGPPPVSPTPVSLDDGHTVGAQRWPAGATSIGGNGQPVGGLECIVNLPEAFHVHAHLSIFLNGEALAVPANVGVAEQSPTTACSYSVHTHDGTGKIHVEAAAPGAFTLGQFFAVWGHQLSSSNIADLTGMPVVVYVTDNGVVTQNTGDWSAIELTSHREITIQVGTAITQIPNFTWSGS